MEKKKNISMAVIKRLPKYHRYLNELLKNDIDRINHDLGDIKFEIEFLEWKSNLSFFKRYFSKFRKFTKEKYFMWKHTNE